MKTKTALLALLGAVMLSVTACNTPESKKDPVSIAAVITAIADTATSTPVVPTATVTMTATLAVTLPPTMTPVIMLTPGKNEKAMDYYPVHAGNMLFFTGRKKNDLDKVLKVKAEIVGIEKKDGRDYFYFYSPSVGIRYLMRTDENGVYMGVIKYPFPLFGFPIEVDLNPEMVIMKSPVKAGEKWTYKGRAEATLFGFLKLGRDIQSDFECVRKEKIRTGAGNFEAFHIKVLVNDGAGNVTTEKYWYAKGLGYSLSDTSGHDAYLVGYKIFNEKTGKFDEKLPEGAEKYE